MTRSVDPLLFLLRLAADDMIGPVLRAEAKAAAITWMAGGADQPWHRIFRARCAYRGFSPKYANRSLRDLRRSAARNGNEIRFCAQLWQATSCRCI